MSEVGACEARTLLSRLLERVARGERITITRHGVPVAVLVPASPRRGRDAEKLVEQLKSFRRGKTLGKVSLKKLIDEGRP
jgi:prevent-host-death family protein